MNAPPFPATPLTALLALLALTANAAAPLVWNDEFDQPVGSAPDPAKWVHELGASGWGNNELQNYTDARENSVIIDDPDATDGKALVITARKTGDDGYTSARLKTQGKFSVRFGRVEARLRAPRGQGIWPAFWMMADNIETTGWPEGGEIDVLEIVGHQPGVAHGTVHGPGYSGVNGPSGRFTLPDGKTFAADYHVFAIDWSPGRIAWSVDGHEYHVVTPKTLPAGSRWVFDDGPFFLLLNLAVGGNWPGYPDATTTFPQTLVVDYVRVYASASEATSRRTPGG